MSFCMKCGSELPAEEEFCRNCGAPTMEANSAPEMPAVTPPQSEEAPTYAPQPQSEEAPTYAPQPQSEEAPTYAPQPLNEETAEQTEVPLEEKKKKKPLLWLLLAAAVVALAVLAVIFLPKLLHPGLSAELERVEKKMATVNSLSYHSQVSVDANGGTAISVDLDGVVNIDREGKQLQMYMEYGYGESAVKMLAVIADNKLRLTMYDQYSEQWTVVSEQEMQTDALFEDMQENTSVEDIDWAQLIEQAQMQEYVDAAQIPDLLNRVERKLNDEAFLKEKCGYSRALSDGNTVYSFKPDLKVLLDELLQDLRPVLKNEAREELDEELQESEEITAVLEGLALQAELTVDRSSYLTGIGLTLEMSPALTEQMGIGISYLRLQMSFSDFNNAEIPAEALGALPARAE